VLEVDGGAVLGFAELLLEAPDVFFGGVCESLRDICTYSLAAVLAK
jgi:hypothetical protein